MRDTDEAELYTNRELSWLLFNRRVLSEAANLENPALERLRFLSITASNLDEFFMVRFAMLRAQVLAGDETPDLMGYLPRERMRMIAEDARLFMDEQIEVLRAYVYPALAEAGLAFLNLSTATESQKKWVENIFVRDILPKVTLTIHTKKNRLYPAGRTLQLALLLTGKKGETHLATLAQPQGMTRAYKLPKALGGGVALLEDILMAHAQRLAPGHTVTGCWPFRVTRDADFTVPDSVTRDLVTETEKSLQRRKTGDVVRLEIDARAPESFIKRMITELPVDEELVYRIDGPLNLTFLNKELYGTKRLGALRYQLLLGRVPDALAHGESVFDALAAGDILLHHPYDSFDAVQRFIHEAAADPRVIAIKQTLYRVSGDSPIIKALCDAAEAGKRVTVLLEVKARFDEENNIRWGEVLEKAGCTVLYGVPHVKTHSKITLVVRREGDGLRAYMHLGTGNYNDVTAKQYTDMGILTCNPELGEDAHAFFNMVTGFSREPVMKRLVYAPKRLRPALMEMIRMEMEHAQSGQPSGIVAKMNSLVDAELIHLLYEASRAGVPIRLIVRGVCCLRAGVPGLSETIQVHSIIGRFLEHSRIFRFENGGEPKTFLSSADWMPRNLNRRLELMFPLMDPAVCAKVDEVLELQWRDTAKSWAMEPDGQYRRVPRGAEAINAQELLFTNQE